MIHFSFAKVQCKGALWDLVSPSFVSGQRDRSSLLPFRDWASRRGWRNLTWSKTWHRLSQRGKHGELCDNWIEKRLFRSMVNCDLLISLVTRILAWSFVIKLGLASGVEFSTCLLCPISEDLGLLSFWELLLVQLLRHLLGEQPQLPTHPGKILSTFPFPIVSIIKVSNLVPLK